MRSDRLIVLKFGGSVLRRDEDVRGATHEVYRHVREGRRVIAVVSAFEGVTNTLLATAGERADGHAAAALVATGELTSAAHLALSLDRAGVRAVTLDAAAIGLQTDGDPMDASPTHLNVGALGGLTDADAIVVPGFVGRDKHGRTTLLGRGGSDLTALFIAHRLGADCVLVKDVDGLYDADPALGPARRFRSVSYEDALGLDGSIVQHKAVRFARDHGLRFRVGSLFAAHGTQVGAPSHFDDGLRPDVPLRVAVVGCGTVGGGVVRALLARPESFDLVAVATRSPERAVECGVDPGIVSNDPDHALAVQPDVLVETIGGIERARSIVLSALRRGVDVVTANKSLVATHGPELECGASDAGACIHWNAAAGGAAPILETAARLATESAVTHVEAVLNGTCGYVLDLLQCGDAFRSAVRTAQQRGFAERDPSADLAGADAAHKLVLMHRALSGRWIDPASIARRAIDAQSIMSALATCGVGRRLAQVAVIGERETPRVELRAIDVESPLGALRAEWCGAVFRCASGREVVVRGKGAGRWPTAESIMADLFDAARRRAVAEVACHAA